MSLATYKKKRNFGATPEPGGKATKGKAANSFVIQRHDATRLHYDFRLEVNGVLKSWAIPKGPSLNPTDKRLAVMVEDHPLAYGGFKGRIPEGNYGAGIVEIWDKGTYQPEEMEKISDNEIDRHIKNGMLKFSLKGKKLKGSFALVRIRGAESKNWLLIKHRDKYATDKPYSSEDETAKNSPINKVHSLEAKTAGRKASVKKKLPKASNSTKSGGSTKSNSSAKKNSPEMKRRSTVKKSSTVKSKTNRKSSAATKAGIKVKKAVKKNAAPAKVKVSVKASVKRKAASGNTSGLKKK